MGRDLYELTFEFMIKVFDRIQMRFQNDFKPIRV